MSRSWVKICPDGDVYHAESDSTQVFDESSRLAMLAHFALDRRVPVDFDHKSSKPSAEAIPAESAGVVIELQNRGPGDGLWALVEWTNKGAAAVEGGSYKSVSPSLESVPTTDGKHRPARLKSLALTNRPAIEELRIMNANNDTLRDDYLGGAPMKLGALDYRMAIIHELGLPPGTKDDDLKQAILERRALCKTLGLPVSATSEQISEAIREYRAQYSNRAGWEVDSEMDYRTELAMALGLGWDATDAMIVHALELPKHTEIDYREQLLSVLGLSDTADDQAIQDGLDELQHPEGPGYSGPSLREQIGKGRHSLSNANSEKVVWGQWDQGLPRMLSTEGGVEKQAHQLASTRNSTQLRALARNYPKHGGQMRDLLNSLADAKDEELLKAQSRQKKSTKFYEGIRR